MLLLNRENSGGLFFLFGVCSGVEKSVEMWKKSGITIDLY